MENTENKPVKKRVFDPTNNKGCGYRSVYEIFPDDNWKKEWGPKPSLGYVKADDEFYAVYAAYNKGLVPVNFTFGIAAVKATRYVRDI